MVFQIICNDQIRDILHFWLLKTGSFENEALKNEDRSTKHPDLENEVPKARKKKHPNLETTVGWRTTSLSLAWRKTNQVEVTHAYTPPKVHKTIPSFYFKAMNCLTEHF